MCLVCVRLFVAAATVCERAVGVFIGASAMLIRHAYAERGQVTLFIVTCQRQLCSAHINMSVVGGACNAQVAYAFHRGGGGGGGSSVASSV